MDQLFQDFAAFRQRYPIRPGDPSTLLGSGSYGKVLKVEDQVETEWVAIKISEFRGNDAKSLRAEVELAQKVPRQANIARYDACHRLDTDTGTNDFAIMKYYPDGNLADLFRHRKLTPDEIFHITEGILLGLQHLHRHRIVHRDFKPANILISRDNQGRFIPKIADFGLSKLVREDEIESSDFDLSDGRGTPSYKAPEQIEGGRVSFNLDLWAFGVILYEMLTGEKPFSANGRSGSESSIKREIELKIMSTALPARLQQIPEPYQRIIRRCLVKDIKQRARNEAELLDLLHGRISPADMRPEATIESTDKWDEELTDLREELPLPVPAKKSEPDRARKPQLVTATANTSDSDKPGPDRVSFAASPQQAVLSQRPATQLTPLYKRPVVWVSGIAMAALMVGAFYPQSPESDSPKSSQPEQPNQTINILKPKPGPRVNKVVSQYFKDAQGNFRQGNYKETMDDLEQVLTVDPDNREARKLYEIALKKFREARTEREPDLPTPAAAVPVQEPSPAIDWQARYNELIDRGISAINNGNNKVQAMATFTQASQLAEQHNLNREKAKAAYQDYFKKGLEIMEQDEFDIAKRWFEVARSLQDTPEVRTKINQCTNP